MGRATALELARLGAAVSLVGRRDTLLADLAAEIEAAGGTSLVVPADITDPRAAPHLVKAAGKDPRRGADLVHIGSLAGRNAFGMSAVYCATKFGVGAFTGALRQELASQHVRVSVVEPGCVETELRFPNPTVVQEQPDACLGDIERLRSQDIADAVGYVVSRPRHVAVGELLIRPTEQVPPTRRPGRTRPRVRESAGTGRGPA
ncbi:SDR family NAD(P)-dependent oxidoreductase [Streptomyces sp. NPDC020858]|uniref:SDR family NAD(P)-dependent oxidoreductase n=1 Tax=Streptomyces sp. NPDC020858 TaxID=3365097 RepID=UPI0037B4E0D0